MTVLKLFSIIVNFIFVLIKIFFNIFSRSFEVVDSISISIVDAGKFLIIKKIYF